MPWLNKKKIMTTHVMNYNVRPKTKERQEFAWQKSRFFLWFDFKNVKTYELINKFTLHRPKHIIYIKLFYLIIHYFKFKNLYEISNVLYS